MIPIPAPFRTTDDVRTGLTTLEQHFLSTGDRRGVFLTAYRTITAAVEAQCAAGGFRDNAWVEQYLIAFGTLYRDALVADVAGDAARVPKAWRLAFDAARQRRGWVIQHLILGVNAHINHDLALALLTAGIDPDRATRYADHTAVNAVLERATPALKAQVSALWAPILTRLDQTAGTLDDEVIAFSIPKARDHAWAMAVAIDATRGSVGEQMVRSTLDEQAAVVARLVLAPPVATPVVDRSKRLLERVDRVVRTRSRVADLATDLFGFARPR
jgi:hypothetical protein